MKISASVKVQLWLEGLPPATKTKVRAALKKLVAGTSDDVKPLRGELEGFYRLRLGDYRMVYHLEPDQVIRLDYADLRETVYETFLAMRRLREAESGPNR